MPMSDFIAFTDVAFGEGGCEKKASQKDIDAFMA